MATVDYLYLSDLYDNRDFGKLIQALDSNADYRIVFAFIDDIAKYSDDLAMLLSESRNFYRIFVDYLVDLIDLDIVQAYQHLALIAEVNPDIGVAVGHDSGLTDPLVLQENAQYLPYYQLEILESL